MCNHCAFNNRLIPPLQYKTFAHPKHIAYISSSVNMDMPFYRCPLCECGFYSPYVLVCTYNHKLCRRCFSRLNFSNFVCIYCRSKYQLYRIKKINYNLRTLKKRPRNLVLISKSPTPNHYYVRGMHIRYL